MTPPPVPPPLPGSPGAPSASPGTPPPSFQGPGKKKRASAGLSGKRIMVVVLFLVVGLAGVGVLTYKEVRKSWREGMRDSMVQFRERSKSEEERIKAVAILVSTHVGGPMTGVSPDQRLVEDLKVDAEKRAGIVDMLKETFLVEIPSADAEKWVTLGDIGEYLEKAAPPGNDPARLNTEQARIEAFMKRMGLDKRE